MIDPLQEVRAADSSPQPFDTAWKPTIVVVHSKERRSKCTVAGLRGDPRFQFVRHPRRPVELDNYVRLGLTGPVLSPADAQLGLLVLDGTWRWASRMERAYAALPCRTLPPLVTAYPRHSKVSDDPTQGLATVEAIYAAWVLQGRPTDRLLDGYPWSQPFLDANPWLLLRSTVGPDANTVERPR
jgi:pre-rRNA-processing protein TSR3